MKLSIAPQAADDIEVAARWWAANRPGAPDLFQRELWEAMELISSMPSAGGSPKGSRPPGVRRVPLPKTRYLLYYRVDVAAGVARVLRLWHMSRGKAPKL